MTTSNEGIALIKQFEGCRLTAYKDSVGVPTIGYGHTRGVRMGQTITQVEALRLLREDLLPVERTLNALNVNMPQRTYDALASWIYNLGTGNFSQSTLKRQIIARASDHDIAAQIIRWTRAGGKVLKGLQLRRIAEANHMLGSEYYQLINGVITHK